MCINSLYMQYEHTYVDLHNSTVTLETQRIDMHTYTNVFMYVHIYLHTQICTHTHTHTHIHMS
jgi:hypothetical protein